MIEDDLEISTADGTSDSVLFAPAREGRWPGVLMLTDIGGIRDSHRQMARQLAKAYTVLMPNLFYRNGRAPFFDKAPDFSDDRVRARVAELKEPLTPDAVERDASSYVDTLLAHPNVTRGPLVVVGYCASGSIALRVAAARPDAIVAAASFHGGGLVTDMPTSPHLLLSRVKARLYFGHATNDRSMPADAIERLERALAAWGGTYESETYPAGHGWTVPDNPQFNAEQAARAFAKLTELFASVQGASDPGAARAPARR
jgi:carboxymethylenebutenolidase